MLSQITTPYQNVIECDATFTKIEVVTLQNGSGF